jgi:hypothetical protein
MALRDRSNRIAFRLIAVGILLMFVLSIAGGFAEMGRGSQTAAQLPEGFSGRTIAALITLLVILPTAVIAWLQPVDGELWPFRLQTWVPLLAVPLIGIAWLAATTLAPEQTLTRVGSNGGFSEANVTCEHYAGQQRVGFEFGGAIRVGAEVCWNGQKAFVVGDPSLTPAGADLPPEASFIPFFNDLVSCAPYPTDADFANVTQQCTEQIDDLGTMHLLVTGLVSPTPLSLGKRHLQIELVVDRNGKVLRFD